MPSEWIIFFYLHYAWFNWAAWNSQSSTAWLSSFHPAWAGEQALPHYSMHLRCVKDLTLRRQEQFSFASNKKSLTCVTAIKLRDSLHTMFKTFLKYSFREGIMNGKYHAKVYFVMLLRKIGIIYFTVKLELRISMDHSNRKKYYCKLHFLCKLWYC